MGLPPEVEDESYSEYDYADNVSANGGLYNDNGMIQDNMYDNNYYSEGSYNEPYSGTPYKTESWLKKSFKPSLFP